jgi:hypothetical protein
VMITERTIFTMWKLSLSINSAGFSRMKSTGNYLKCLREDFFGEEDDSVLWNWNAFGWGRCDRKINVSFYQWMCSSIELNFGRELAESNPCAYAEGMRDSDFRLEWSSSKQSHQL